MELTKGLRIAVAAAALAAGAVTTFLAAEAAQPKEKVIKIVAKRFKYTPGKLTVKKGTPVILEFTSEDVAMGFNLPDFNLRSDMLPGKVLRVRFVPDKTGTFTFLCDIFCGTGHEEMHGQLAVVD